ncbi:hypothetical protein VNO77_21271 [Canavalia gladiata]|uniref:Uncharacterized protein n=1 Tax=Canavalia gladiata TaxID=3824 RepID=A0AAN9QLY4_CANGL
MNFCSFFNLNGCVNIFLCHKQPIVLWHLIVKHFLGEEKRKQYQFSFSPPFVDLCALSSVPYGYGTVPKLAKYSRSKDARYFAPIELIS